MCAWDRLSPWEEWAVEMTAPGLELLTEMQNKFLESELCLDHDEFSRAQLVFDMYYVPLFRSRNFRLEVGFTDGF